MKAVQPLKLLLDSFEGLTLLQKMSDSLLAETKRLATRLLENNPAPKKRRHTQLALHVNLRRAMRVSDHCVLNTTRSNEDIEQAVRYWKEAVFVQLGPCDWL